MNWSLPYGYYLTTKPQWELPGAFLTLRHRSCPYGTEYPPECNTPKDGRACRLCQDRRVGYLGIPRQIRGCFIVVILGLVIGYNALRYGRRGDSTILG